VIAGRAAPGWQVSVQSSGTKVAVATADAQGEWSAVLDKPLPAGDHALTLKITSPDGTRALSSQELVRVEVGDAAKPAAPSAEATATVPQAPPQAAEATATVPQALPQAAAPSAPAPPGQAGASPQPGAAMALAEPQGEVRAVPRSAEQSAAPQTSKPALVFKTVDYQDTGAAIGSVSITGTSEPGATISVYCDNERLATVRAGADGTWRVVAEKKLGTGQHNFRAERIDATTGTPSAQAMIAIERLVPKPAEVAAKEATPKPAPGSPSTSVAAADDKDVYTIRRGDTLWAIAKRYLGSGLRYTTIFQDNRETINNPNLIHPKQQVKVPTP
jgi:nucleoid-associated protein YgaU